MRLNPPLRCDDLGTPGWDQYFGFGRINAYRVTTAAKQSISTDTIAPSVTILSPGSGATVSGVVAITGTATDNIGVVTVQLWIDGVLDSTCALSRFRARRTRLASVLSYK